MKIDSEYHVTHTVFRGSPYQRRRYSDETVKWYSVGFGWVEMSQEDQNVFEKIYQLTIDGKNPFEEKEGD